MQSAPRSLHLLQCTFAGFRELFDSGVSAYLAGEWEVSREDLEVALHAKPDDGPCKTLLEYMSGFSFVCPASWPGYRELTEK